MFAELLDERPLVAGRQPHSVRPPRLASRRADLGKTISALVFIRPLDGFRYRSTRQTASKAS